MATKYQGVHKESTGYKMLAALGWKEGEGLGSKKQGITEHLRVKKKHERVGVGAAEATAKARDWTLGMVAYDRVLSTLSEVTSQHAAAGSDSDSDASDGEIDAEAAAAAAAKSTRAAKKATKGKGLLGSDPVPVLSKKDSKKRKAAAVAAATAAVPSSESDSAPSGDDDSSPESEAAPEPEVKRVRRATHVGRFKKREAGKRVGGYSSTDLAAILGGNNPWESRAEEVEADALERAPTPDTPSASEPRMPTSSDSPQPNEARAAAAAEAEASSAQQAADELTWWHGYFMRAGRLGAIRRVKPSEAKIKVDGFEEADQEALWTSAHDGATKSKQGLGRAGAPKKVAGAHWAGTKTKLDSDDEGEDGASGSGSDASDSEEEMATGIVMVAPKSAAIASAVQKVPQKKGEPEVSQTSAAESAPVPPSASASQTAAALDSVKWKKLAKRALEGQPGNTLKLSKLTKLALASAKLPVGTDEGIAGAAFETRLRGSTIFIFKGKSVSLA